VSKAFTRESDDLDPADAPSFRSQLPAGTRNYVTSEWAARVKQQLQDLLEKKKTDSAPGAVSESEAKRLDVQIRNLQQSLGSMIVAEIPADQGKVAFGATVVVRRGSRGEESYRIVGIEEADPEQGTISWISPLARVLMAKGVGDKVRFQSPAGEDELTILAVRYAS
jgi:transcription elongation factor GreB